ncbi:hypothetical protein KQY30_05650 [Streptomyces sp. GMY02]|uniref:hypothetical protein n=1 Tax=Streptomyces sp. GMY02 TaxID=1333528 RepID=UPI001C2BEC16|nr:hypothetical protein KQY30_05650 [Streptomyces sp. GMY02]
MASRRAGALTTRVDIDPEQAVRTRLRLLAALADTDTLLLGTHFPKPAAGVVRTDNGRYRFIPEPGTVVQPRC